MQLTQRQLLDILNNLSLIQSNEWATLLLRKKNELMLRNVLTILLEKYCRDIPLPSDVMALHEFNKHDVAIVTRTKPKTAYRYIPNTLIELKFTNAFWITINEEVTNFLGDEKYLQDNIWRENYQYRKPPGNEKGVKYDLIKLISKQATSKSPIAIHHVIGLVNPHQIIDEKYKFIVDYMDSKNKCIEFYGDHQRVFKQAVEILEKQLKVIQDVYLNNRKFKIDSTSIPLGTAFGTKVDLGFVVISENGN